MNIEEILLDKKEMSKIMTRIENGDEDLSSEILKHIKGARIIGVTGVPGSGKSTLITKLSSRLLEKGHRIGIIGVDPSSPFSGGAVLGDRVRMKDLNKFENVFIRSISTRGKIGGLSYYTADLVNVLDAAGYDTIFIETVGTGQDEVDVFNIAHTIIVLQVPTLGDEVQIIKAGQLEIGDIYIVNKADQGPADEKIKELNLILKKRENGWQPLVIKTVAVKNVGIEEIINALDEHWNFVKETGLFKRKINSRIKYMLKQHALEKLDKIMESEVVDSYAEQIIKGRNMHEIVNEIINKVGGEYGKGGIV
ncbi:MAG: methylmalonyl Co-A mutase-associated GTPase MeaB [Thermoplasmata archaeon]